MPWDGKAGLERALGALLEHLEGTAPCESELEVMTARRLRAAGFPKPVRQLRVTIFGKVYRLDFAWPEVRLALECDGRAFHEFQRDRTRWRHLGADGWKVLPVTWHDVTQDWPGVQRELATAFR